MLRGQAVAWQTVHQRALEVDHILPRNQGGSDGLSNQQAFASFAMPASDGKR